MSSCLLAAKVDEAEAEVDEAEAVPRRGGHMCCRVMCLVDSICTGGFEQMSNLLQDRRERYVFIYNIRFVTLNAFAPEASDSNNKGYRQAYFAAVTLKV